MSLINLPPIFRPPTASEIEAPPVFKTLVLTRPNDIKDQKIVISKYPYF